MTFRFSLWLKVIVILFIPFLLVACVRSDDVEGDGLCKNSENWDQCLNEVVQYGDSVVSCNSIWMGQKNEFWAQCRTYFAHKNNNSALCCRYNKQYCKDCFYYFALDKNSFSDCYEFSITRHHDPVWMCIGDAKIGDLSSVCNSSENFDFRRDCFYFYTVYGDDPRFCEKIKGEDSEKNICYHEVALEAKDVTFCDYISDEDTRYRCYYDLVVQEGSCSGSSICEDMGNNREFYDCLYSGDAKQCFINSAVTQKDLKWCSYLEDDVERRECYETFIKSIDNLSYCSTGATEFSRGFCEEVFMRNEEEKISFVLTPFEVPDEPTYYGMTRKVLENESYKVLLTAGNCEGTVMPGEMYIKDLHTGEIYKSNQRVINAVISPDGMRMFAGVYYYVFDWDVRSEFVSTSATSVVKDFSKVIGIPAEDFYFFEDCDMGTPAGTVVLMEISLPDMKVHNMKIAGGEELKMEEFGKLQFVKYFGEAAKCWNFYQKHDLVCDSLSIPVFELDINSGETKKIGKIDKLNDLQQQDWEFWDVSLMDPFTECIPRSLHECQSYNGNILWKDSCGRWSNETYQRCCTGCSAGDTECPVAAQGGVLGEGGGKCPNLGE